MKRNHFNLFKILGALVLLNACSLAPKEDVQEEKQILGDRFRIKEYYQEEIKVKEVSIDDTVKWIREYVNDSISLEYYRMGRKLEGPATFYKQGKIIRRKIYWQGEEWVNETYHWNKDRLDSITFYKVDSIKENKVYAKYYGRKVFNDKGKIDTTKSKYFSYYPSIPLFIKDEWNAFVFTFYSSFDEHSVSLFDDEPVYTSERNMKVIMVKPTREGFHQYFGEVGFCDFIPEDTTLVSCSNATFYAPVYVIDRKDLYKK
jgi:hypothetical protein